MKEPTPIASFDRADPAHILAARLRETCFQASVVDTRLRELRREVADQQKAGFAQRG